MADDYSVRVRLLYDRYATCAILLDEHYVVEAGVLVERYFPPRSAYDVLRVLVALNLLNAAVKHGWGRRMVTYRYIKGMAACLFVRLLSCPVDGVSVYRSRTDDVTYFRVKGVQVSFHYVPYYRELLLQMPRVPQQPMEWEGLQLQKISVELLRMVCPQPPPVTAEDEADVRRRMLYYIKPLPSRLYGDVMARPSSFIADSEAEAAPSTALTLREQMLMQQLTLARRSFFGQPFRENKVASLCSALDFNIWQRNAFVLYRRKDDRPMPVIRYTGNNYNEVIRFLLHSRDRVYRRPPSTLKAGSLYYISPQKRLRTISPSRHVLCMTQNNYLMSGQSFENLCLTYGIARFLAVLYPRMRFVCTLNYNRLTTHRRYYALADLYQVPMRSQARQLKVWMAVDPQHDLRDFDVSMLPPSLVAEYMEAEDYYQEFEIITDRHGLKGLYAYRRHHLLPCIYEDIVLRNYHAHVLGHNGLWALYALNQERFISDFIYERVWYESSQDAIMGLVDGVGHIIFKFRFAR